MKKITIFSRLMFIAIIIANTAHAMQNDADLGEQLLNAAIDGNHEAIEQLIKAGAPVDYADDDGTTALQFAANSFHLKCIQILIAAGAQVNHQNRYGTTALMYAASANNLSCAQALITAKAKTNLTTNHGWTALMYAIVNDNIVNGNQAVCELLVERMLRIPSQKQKAGMITLLGIGKTQKKLCPYGLDSCLRNQFKAVCPGAVYENNKQNFANSVAYQELMRIKALPEMQDSACTKQIEALLEKYNTGITISESQSWCTVQ